LPSATFTVLGKLIERNSQTLEEKKVKEYKIINAPTYAPMERE